MRRTTPLLTLTLALPLALPTNAQKCAAPPLPLPIRALAIIPGALTSGIPVSLGTPAQHLALVPSLQLSHTFIPVYTNSCVYNEGMTLPSDTNTSTDSRRGLLQRRGDDAYPGDFEEEGEKGRYWAGQDWTIKCAEVYGGGYAAELSSSFGLGKGGVGEAWFDRTGYTTWRDVADSFEFGDYVGLYTAQNDAMPPKRNVTADFVLPEKGAVFGHLGPATLGLAPESLLVKRLVEEKMVASRSWSLTRASLCLGCIDGSASKGAFQVFKPADSKKQDGLPCVLQASVTALNYHPDAKTEGVTLIEKPFTACVDPGVAFLVLPPDARGNLPGVLGRTVKAAYEDYTVFQGPPKNNTGILTIKLEGGLTVNVTVPGAGKIDAQETGVWRVPVGKGGWGAYGRDVPVLGRPFTDHVVLRWDDRKEEYGIANTNPDYMKQDLKPLGCDEFPAVEHTTKATPKANVIVASVLGGFASGLLFAVTGMFFFRRGQKGVAGKYEPMSGEDAVALRAVSVDGRESRASDIHPPPGLRASLRSHFSSRSVSPMPGPQMVDDAQIFEAPEGGTAYPTKRQRGELWVHALDHR